MQNDTAPLYVPIVYHWRHWLVKLCYKKEIVFEGQEVGLSSE
ncbi:MULTISPECIES: hypothetical protein [Proteus]|nr:MULTISPECIES: hypothetical protein [Proteus]